ncbi:unnamed protein product [Sphagnum balticum]
MQSFANVVDSNTSLPDSTHQTYRYRCQKEGTFGELFGNHTHPSHLGSWRTGICCTTPHAKDHACKSFHLFCCTKKKEEEGARGLGIELLESKKDEKDEISRIREKKKNKKVVLQKREEIWSSPLVRLLPPPLSPNENLRFCSLLLSSAFLSSQAALKTHTIADFVVGVKIGGKLEVRLLGSGQGRQMVVGWSAVSVVVVVDAGPVAEQIRFRSPSHVLLGRGLFEDRVLRLLKV